MRLATKPGVGLGIGCLWPRWRFGWEREPLHERVILSAMPAFEFLPLLHREVGVELGQFCVGEWYLHQYSQTVPTGSRQSRLRQ
jgi:hypothetical protein